jgi:hypothetical protein
MVLRLDCGHAYCARSQESLRYQSPNTKKGVPKHAPSLHQ